MKPTLLTKPYKIIIGLGNPGTKYYKTRHSIGYRVVDQLVDQFGGRWQDRGIVQTADIMINEKPVIVIKPNTYMNDSGKVMPFLAKKGIDAQDILVVHDELEKPFNALAFKIGGSHRGHNGLRSLIDACGPDFARLRFGIARPEDKKDVAEYVLQPFTKQQEEQLSNSIDQAVAMIEALYQGLD